MQTILHVGNCGGIFLKNLRPFLMLILKSISSDTIDFTDTSYRTDGSYINFRLYQ